MAVCKECKWFNNLHPGDGAGCLCPDAGARPDHIFGGYVAVAGCPANADGMCKHYAHKQLYEQPIWCARCTHMK